MPIAFSSAGLARLGIWLLALGLAGPAAAQQVGPGERALPEPWQTLNREVRELAAQRHVVGFAVAVVVQGRLVWQHSHGPQQVGGQSTIDGDSPILLGQISALYLAAVALRLEHHGLLDLDARVTDLLPTLRIGRVPSEHRAPTVREILLGRSGLSMGRLEGRYCRAGECRPLSDRDEELYALSEPMVLGGLQSAAAMDVLVRVLEKASGLDIETLIGREVAEPLGLETPGFGASAPLHRKGKRIADLLTRERHTLGAVTTLDQLRRLSQALLAADDGWLPRASRFRLFSAQPLGDSAMPWARAAFLFRVSDLPEVGPEVARIASFYPYSDVRMHIVAEHGIAVLAASNFDPEDASLGKVMAAALHAALSEAGVDSTPPGDDDAPLPETIPLPGGLESDEFAARYATVFGLFETATDGGQYKVTSAGWNFTASPRDDGWYRLRLRVLRIPIGLSFLNRVAVRPVRLGERRLLLMSTPGTTVILGSAWDTPADAREIARWQGEYRLVNPDPLAEQADISRVEVVLADGVPQIRVPLPGLLTPTLEIPLEREQGDLYRVAGFGPGLGERFQFRIDDGTAELEYSGYRLRRQ
jgi:CubicO group peptidase (beta-lactamase class C family)